jgi:sigma-E factor negative regulatory protein RseA
MNEELDSQLSAMFDDELPEGECQLLARRLSRDDTLKVRWRRYAVIGAAVRAERGVRMDLRLETNLATRVSATISAEPALEGTAVAQSRSRAGGGMRWWQPVAGVGIAAGVAAMSVLWVRSQGVVGSDTLVAQNAPPSTTVMSQPVATSASTYVVPTKVEPRTPMPAAELANYLFAHSEYSTPVTRRFPLSSLVSSESGTRAGGNASDGAVDAVPVEDAVENAKKAQ